MLSVSISLLAAIEKNSSAVGLELDNSKKDMISDLNALLTTLGL